MTTPQKCQHGVDPGLCALCIEGIESQFDGQKLWVRVDGFFRCRWIAGTLFLKDSLVIDSLSDVRVGVTLSITAVSIVTGPGWHPFLKNEQARGNSLSITVVNGRLTVTIHLI